VLPFFTWNPQIVVLVYIDFYLYFHYFDLCFRLSDIPDVWKFVTLTILL
jgi:hypothetical protein